MSLVLDLSMQPFGHSELPAPALRPCAGCSADLPLEAYRVNKAGRFGRTARCRECLTAKDRVYNATPERVEMERARVRTDEYRSWSRSRDAVRNRQPERQAQVNSKNKRRRALRKGAAVDVFTDADLYASWDEAGYSGCYWCDEPFTDADPMHVDHLVPLASGGPHAIHNLVPAHMTCNTSKGAKDPNAYARERYPWLP